MYDTLNKYLQMAMEAVANGAKNLANLVSTLKDALAQLKEHGTLAYQEFQKIVSACKEAFGRSENKRAFGSSVTQMMYETLSNYLDELMVKVDSGIQGAKELAQTIQVALTQIKEQGKLAWDQFNAIVGAIKSFLGRNRI